MDPDSGVSEKTVRKQQEEEERDEEAQNYRREEGQLVTSIFEVLMNMVREEEAEERGAWCIMGSPPVV